MMKQGTKSRVSNSETWASPEVPGGKTSYKQKRRASARKHRKKAASPCRPNRSKGQKQPVCKECGLPISFVQRYSEKQKKLVWYVTNTDGTDHWDACSHAKWLRNGGVQYQNYGHTIGKDHEKLYDPADTSVPWVE